MAHTLSAAGDTSPAPHTPDRSSPPTGTVTFLFTDIEGSTALWERHREDMQAALAQHHAILRDAIEANDGYVFNIAGDAFCAAFATAPAGLAAALGAQRTLQSTFKNQEPIVPQQTGSTIIRIRVRMGLHTGSAEAVDRDYRSGPTLNQVAHVMALAHGGQILVSQTTADLVPNEAMGVTLRDMGLHRLKGLADPERILQVVAPDLPSEFPPLAASTAFPNNLPMQLTSFVGRDSEIAQVKRLLMTTRLLTLTGSGGTGKTRLSLALAGEVLEQFSDGVWFVELAPLADPTFVPQTVASALGLREEPGRPVIDTLREHLSDKQALLVLDNCEHLIASCAAFADTILHAAARIKVLASSREALGIAGEATYHVPSLPSPNPVTPMPVTDLAKYDAVRLFVERAVAAKSNFTVSDTNATAVAQVCFRLDGIPLAIELAAARVKVFSADQIAARLDDRFRLLTGGSRTALPRQQTLRGAIDWSHSLLPEPERILLRRLSVFAGGWSFEAAEKVASMDILDLLTRLVEQSLVVAEEKDGEVRYRLLETIRQYAREKLLDSGEGAQVRNRHLEFFVTLAEEAEPKLRSAEQVLWLDRLEMEHDNLRAALDWSLEGTQLVSGLHLAGTLGYFWWIRGHLVEGLTRLNELLARSQSLGPIAARAQAFLWAGWFTYGRREYPAARLLLEQGLTISRELGDKRTIALSLNFLGATAIALDDPAGGRAFLEESLTLLAAQGDKSVLAQTLWSLGDATLLVREYAQARGLYERSLKLLQELGDRNAAATVYRPLGYIALHEGDYSRATTLCRESLNCNLEVREMGGVIRSIGGLAIVAAARGQFTHAARLLGAVEALLESMHYQLYPLDQIEYDRTMAVLRTQLDELTFNAAWAEGRALSMEQAIALALDETKRP